MESKFVSVGDALRDSLSKQIKVTGTLDSTNRGTALGDDPAKGAPLQFADDPAPAESTEAAYARSFSGQETTGQAEEPEVEAEAAPAESEEVPAEASVEVSAKSGIDFDKRFAKLSEASKKMQSEREAIKAERAAVANELAEYKRWKEIISSAKEDPVSLAELAGVRPDEYATLLMDKGSLNPERKKILELEKSVREERTWRQQQEAKATEQQVTRMQQQALGTLKQFGQENAERFDLVNRLGRQNDVLEVIAQHYQATIDPESGVGEILPYEQAFQVVEDLLDKQVSPLLESPKLKRKLSESAGDSAPAQASQRAAVRKPSGTISSKARVQSSPPREMSEAERTQKAGELFFAQLRGNRG